MKLILARFLFIAAIVVPCTLFGQGKMSDIDSMRSELNRQINAKRSIYKEAPLPLNDTLNAIAQKHSEDMAAGRLPLGHDGFANRADQIRAHFGEYGPIAENVVEGDNATEAVELWWTSEGHKANMLGDYNLTGIGAAKSKSGIWLCTQIFIKR